MSKHFVYLFDFFCKSQRVGLSAADFKNNFDKYKRQKWITQEYTK